MHCNGASESSQGLFSLNEGITPLVTHIFQQLLGQHMILLIDRLVVIFEQIFMVLYEDRQQMIDQSMRFVNLIRQAYLYYNGNKI